MLIWEKIAKMSIVKEQLFPYICLKFLSPWEKRKAPSPSCRDFPACVTWGGGYWKADCFHAVTLHRALSWCTEKSVNKWQWNVLEPPLIKGSFEKRRVKSWGRVAVLGEEVYCSLWSALCLWPGLGVWPYFGGSRAVTSPWVAVTTNQLVLQSKLRRNNL